MRYRPILDGDSKETRTVSVDKNSDTRIVCERDRSGSSKSVSLQIKDNRSRKIGKDGYSRPTLSGIIQIRNQSVGAGNRDVER